MNPFSCNIFGVDRLMGKLMPPTIKDPLAKAIQKITLQMERLTKEATVVDTGNLRSSIFSQITPDQGQVGTNVEYAEFVEYGTYKMEARHMEGGGKVFGLGMFGYALGKLKEWIASHMNNEMAKDIEVKFNEH